MAETAGRDVEGGPDRTSEEQANDDQANGDQIDHARVPDRIGRTTGSA